MTVLVTGATGLIGRRLIARLAEGGDRVRALTLPGEVASAAAESITGDVTRPETLTAAVAGVDKIFHLAAVVGDWGAEEQFVAVNVEGTRNLLDAAAAAGCGRFVHVSSVVVYGSQLRTEVCHEDLPREHGVGPYSRSKRASEEVALDYHAFGRVPVTVVRPGNVYGPGSKLWVDEVAAVIRRGVAPAIDGGHGDACLAYVDNVVDVMVRAAGTDRALGRIYNANDGAGVSWLQYLTDLAAVIGVRSRPRAIPASVAWLAAGAMERAWSALRLTRRPLLTREAFNLLASRQPVPVDRARAELEYDPPVTYSRAIEEVARYLEGAGR